MARSIAANSISLTIAKGAKFLTPLIILPIVYQRLGANLVGIFIICEALNNTLHVFSDYGFPLSATKQVSLYRRNKKELRKIISSIIYLKMIFIFLIGISLISISYVSDVEPFIRNLYSIMFLYLVGNCFTFPWFFQGIEDARAITVSQITFNLITILGIISFVKDEKDFLFLPLFYSIGALLSGLISFIFSLNYLGWQLCFPNKDGMISELKNGFNIFLAYLSMSGYSSMNIYFLGILSSNEEVTIYKICMSIALAFSEVLSPISSSVYSRLILLMKRSKKLFNNLFKRIILNVMPIYILLSFLLLIFSKKIILLFGYSSNNEINDIFLKKVSYLPLLQGFCIYGTIFLLVSNMNKKYLAISFQSLIFNLPLSLLLIYFYKIDGAIISYFITSFYVAIRYWKIINILRFIK